MCALRLYPVIGGLTLIASTAFAGGSPGVAWERDYQAAFAKAAKRGVPVLIAFNMDDEPANDATARGLYRDPEFIKRSRDFVCLIASVGRHATHEETLSDGTVRKVCDRFGGVTCDEHRRVEIKASDEFVGRDTVIAPQHILVTPERHVLARRAYVVSRQQLLEMMRMAKRSLEAIKSGKDPELERIEQLKADALGRDAQRRSSAIQELARMARVEAREMLFDLVAPACGESIRLDAIDALASPGNYDAFPVLVERLRDRSLQVVAHAVVGLERIGLPDAVPELIKLWKRRPKVIVAREIPRALAHCAPDDPKAREVIYRAASSREMLVELSGTMALAELVGDAKAVGILARKLRDRSANVRGLAVWSLGSMQAEDALEDLAKLGAREKHPDVTRCIELAIRHIETGSSGEDSELAGMARRFLRDDVVR